jgi:hypothetical protein
MFDYAGWVIGGIIDGYRNGEISYCETTDRAEQYKANGTLTQAQAEEIAIACSQPIEEPETVVEEPETPVIDETPIEEEIDEGEGT